MVTGASTANLALILVDARKGVIEQTRRHTAITNLLGIQHLVLCVNKMDLVDWSYDVFAAIESEYRVLACRLGVPAVTVIPMAAVSGANIVEPSERTPWYQGPPLLEFLEQVEVPDPARHAELRFPVQYVIRPQTAEHHDYRGYSGTVAAGIAEVGAAVTVLPLGKTTRITGIDRFNQSIAEAEHGDAVTIRLAEDLDISRGYMLVSATPEPPTTSRFSADICWMSDSSVLRPGNKYWIKHTTRRVKCIVESLDSLFDVQTLEHLPNPPGIALNDIARITVKTTEPLFLDEYERSRDTGSFILIDAATRRTVAAGMVRDVRPPASDFQDDF
jgi:bifunctional enzyme CysN/CysC